MGKTKGKDEHVRDYIENPAAYFVRLGLGLVVHHDAGPFDLHGDLPRASGG